MKLLQNRARYFASISHQNYDNSMHDDVFELEVKLDIIEEEEFHFFVCDIKQ